MGNPRLNNSGEPTVVASYLVRVEVEGFCRRYLRDRPRDIGDQAPNDKRSKAHHFMGPLDYIAEESGVDTRTLYRLIYEQDVIGESRAEKILMAIDREYLLMNKTIPVVPSPHWTNEAWYRWRDDQCL